MTDKKLLVGGKSVTEVRPLDRAEKFFEDLLPTSPILARGLDLTVFRGVSNASKHKLQPSALRPERLTKVHSLVDLGPPREDGVHQFKVELAILANYFRIADANGLVIPEDTYKLREMLKDPLEISTSDFDVWIPDNLFSLVASAQHYGLPTRLLDWTRNSRVAMYFAAVYAVEHLKKGDSEPDQKLAVWVFTVDRQMRALETPDYRRPEKSGKNWGLRFVTAAAATNPNLHAQEGVFTTWQDDIGFYDSKPRPVDDRPLDELLEQMIGRYPITIPAFHKFTLPITEAPRLLEICFAHGYTAAKLFPGYKGAAQHIQELAMLRQVLFGV
jgi:FRG domain